MSISIIYCPPGVNRSRAPCPKLVQVRPRKRVKLAKNWKKLTRNFERIRFGTAVQKIRHISGTYFAVGSSFFLTLRRLLGKYLRLGAFLNRLMSRTPSGYSKLNHTTANQSYSDIRSEEQIKSTRRIRTVTLGNGKTRLRSFKLSRLRLSCFTPVPFLKKLRETFVKMMIESSRKGNMPGLLMSHHWSFPIATAGLHRI